MPDEFGITPEDPTVEGEQVDPRAFPPGARVLITDPTLVQLEDGTVVPASDYDDVPEALAESNAGGFVQVEGHGWSDEELAARAANDAVVAQEEVVADDAPAPVADEPQPAVYTPPPVSMTTGVQATYTVTDDPPTNDEGESLNKDGSVSKNQPEAAPSDDEAPQT